MSILWRGFTLLSLILGLCQVTWADDLVPVDLAPHTNQLRSSPLGRMKLSHLQELSAGIHTLQGIPFQVSDGILLLRSSVQPDKPEVIPEVAINRSVTRVHVLQGCVFGGSDGDRSVETGTVIGQYVFHFADETTSVLPVVYGDNVRDWWMTREKEVPRARLAWSVAVPNAGEGQTYKHLYLVTWENPTPSKLLTSVDFVASKVAVAAAPFCVAMTLEVPSTVSAPPPAGTASTKTTGPAASPAAAPAPGMTVDSALSAEIAAQLATLEGTCDQILERRDAIVPERTPHLSTIQSSANQITTLHRANAALARQHANYSSRARDLDRARDKSKDAAEQANLSLQLQDVRRSAGRVSEQHASNTAEIARLTAARDAASRELERLNTELLRCWNELEAVRGRRTDLFNPLAQHLQGRDKIVRDQYERWILKDTSWLDGYFWAALAAFELGDSEGASLIIERGKRALNDTAAALGRKPAGGRLHALNGLVATSLPKKRSVGNDDLKSALRVARTSKNDADWMVYVLAGRVALERDKNFTQANTYLQQAAELKDSSLIHLWQARLQTTAPPNAPEHDLAAGISVLQKMWADESQNSWRTGLFLVEALRASGAEGEADELWAKVRLTVPPERLKSLSLNIEHAQGAGDAK